MENDEPSRVAIRTAPISATQRDLTHGFILAIF